MMNKPYRNPVSNTPWWRALPLLIAALLAGSLQAQTYCSSNFSNVTYEFITNVSLAGINNTSTGNIGGPVNYTSQVATLNVGQTLPLSVTIDSDANDYVYAWIDWNHNGELNDPGEQYTLATSTSSAGPHTLNITPPVGAITGNTRMRVMVDWNNSTPNPCRSATYGEAEDYTVNLISVTCTAPPTPGNTTGPGTICATVPFTLGLQNTSFDQGLSYQWESSPDGNTWANATGTGNTYTTTQTASTWYRCQVTCTGHGTTASTPLQVGMESASACSRNALSFDGVNDRVNIPQSPSLAIGGNTITLEAWIYPTSWRTSSFEGSIINSESDANDNGYMLRCGASGTLSFNLGGASDSWHEVLSSSNALTLNTWQHVAGTYDGTTMRLYINGAQVNTTTSSFTIGVAGNGVVIGDWSYGTGRNFPGKIDEVRIWNKTLSAAELAAHQNTAYCGNETGLVGYYQFDQGVRNGNNAGLTTLLDLTANGNNGTLSGFALSGSASNWVEGQTNMAECVPPAPCSGTPAPGNTTGPSGALAGNTVALGLQNATTGTGVNYQWYSSTASASGPWAAVGPNAAIYSPTISQDSWFYCEVTCSAGPSTGSSNVLAVSVLSVNTVPFSGNNTFPCGTNMALRDGGGSGNYPNGSNGYTVLDAGDGGIINISGPYATESNWDFINIYDGVGTGGTQLQHISGTGTMNYTGTIGQTLTVQFTSDASNVASGFEFVVTYSGTCYTPCAGAPTPGNTTGPATICPGVDFTLETQNATSGSGVTYQWESSADGNTWANAPGTSTDATYTTNITADTWYRCQVTCAGNGTTASTPVQVTVGDASFCSRNALSFDGSNDRVDCGEGPSVDITGNAITMEAWVYPTSWRTNIWEGDIINKESNNGGGVYTLRVGAGGKVNVALGGIGETTTPNAVLTLNTWQHVAATYDGSTVRIFVNGVQVHQAAHSGALTSSPGFPLCIGNSFAFPDRGFPGKIDEVRVWNVVVPESQIAAHQHAAYCSDEPGLVAYYQFDQGVRDGNNTAVTTLLDLSPNGNHGTLSGFALTGNTSNWVEGQTDMVECVTTPCAGTPAPGNTTGPSSICAGTNFLLGLQNPTTGTGVTYQWQSSADGSTWANATGASTSSIYSTSQTAASWYRCQVTCDGSTGTSTALEVGTGAIALCGTYCIPTGAQNNSDEIRNFTLGNLNNNSAPSEGTNGYKDYTGSVAPAELNAGTAYTASLTSGSGTLSHGAAIWIDYNDNGVFDASEMVASIGLTILPNQTVSFPAFTALNMAGLHRLRVQYRYNITGPDLDPCTASMYSETEDYLVNVAQMICDEVVVSIFTDNYPDETSWEITNANGDVIASGAPSGANQLVSETVCLGQTPVDGCFGFRIFDDGEDGIAGGNWQIRTTDGKLLLRDDFSDGGVSPSATPLTAGYGTTHPFCLPIGTAMPANNECGVFNNGLGNKVYSVTVPGATQYEFEFSDPDAGFVRRVTSTHNYVHFWDIPAPGLTPGVKYFTRVRTNANGPLADAHYGKGCQMGLSVPVVVRCSELISAPAYGHSCNEARAFGTNNSFIYAKPVTGATEYQFRIYIPGESYDTVITRSTYILQLKWNGNPLENGSTYNVQVQVKVNGLYSGFCPSSCTITIANSATRPEARIGEGSFGEATLWPNPLHDGQVNLSISGLNAGSPAGDPAETSQQIAVDVQDIYGKQVFSKEYRNSGDRFTTVLELPSDIATGVYMVNITVNGTRTVQRLSVIR